MQAQALSFASASEFPSRTWTRTLPHNDFGRAVGDLMSWKVQSRAGLRVSHGAVPLTVGSVVDMRLAGITIPCRVIDVVGGANVDGVSVDDANAAGFTYATLPGHPECGEESFLLLDTPDGIQFTITARSIPGRWWVKMGGPIARWAQSVMVKRYLRMLD